MLVKATTGHSPAPPLHLSLCHLDQNVKYRSSSVLLHGVTPTHLNISHTTLLICMPCTIPVQKNTKTTNSNPSAVGDVGVPTFFLLDRFIFGLKDAGLVHYELEENDLFHNWVGWCLKLPLTTRLCCFVTPGKRTKSKEVAVLYFVIIR